MTAGHEPPQPTKEVALDLKDIERDLEFERAVLEESIKHDYSTSEVGVVPLDRRRPLWHFAGLWLTFQSGFSFLFVGFTLHDGGYRLVSTIGILLLGILTYMSYATLAAYLGARTGQTHSLLTRAIFGRTGSLLVSLFLIIGPIGWVGFQGNLLAVIWDGLYGWNHVLWLGIILSALMIFNNLFGFTGISAFARYLVTPLMFLWILYLVIKGLTEGSSFLGAHPHTDSPLSFWLALGAVIGFAIWGNEQDLFRFGKPRPPWWSVPAYAFGFFFGLFLFGVGGWMMAQISTSSDFGPAVKSTTEYSLFGAFWLAWILALLGQVAINDGNYYEAINAGQNLLGGWKRWRRVYTCLLLAGLGGLAAWLVPYHISNGFFKLAAFQAITLPCASIIMVIDHFVLPRMFKISRPLLRVPAWRDASLINWPGVIALVVAAALGGYGSGIWPGEDPTRYWGFLILETWLLAAMLYIVGVAITQAVAGARVKEALGFSKDALAEPVPPGAIVDIASVEGEAPETISIQPAPAT
jgi:purine-cytosine permease-like protein